MLFTMREFSPLALLFVVACSGASPVVLKVIEVSPDAASPSGSPDGAPSPSLDAATSIDAGSSDPVGNPEGAVDGSDAEKDSTGPRADADAVEGSTPPPADAAPDAPIEASTPPPPADAAPDAPIEASDGGSPPAVCAGSPCPSGSCIPVYQKSCCTSANVCGCVSNFGGGTCQ
jgi:hypothetical protein